MDALITHESVGRPQHVAVDDVGLSDHFLLRWEVSTARAPLPVTTTCCRPWRKLDMDSLRAALSMSRLCQPESWPDDVDELAALYDDGLNSILDRILPLRQYDPEVILLLGPL